MQKAISITFFFSGHSLFAQSKRQSVLSAFPKIFYIQINNIKHFEKEVIHVNANYDRRS